MSDPLASEPFGWQRVGADRVQISYDGKPVTIMRTGTTAATLDRLDQASPAERQRVLASLVSPKKSPRK